MTFILLIFSFINFVILGGAFFGTMWLLLLGEDPTYIRPKDPSLKKVLLFCGSVVFMMWNAIVGLFYNLWLGYETMESMTKWIRKILGV